MTSMLEDVITHGTGYPNAVIGRPAAGKTGTTSNFRDAWFVGYTPDLVTAVWLGNDDYTRMNRIVRRKRSGAHLGAFHESRARRHAAARFSVSVRRGRESGRLRPRHTNTT